MRSALNGHTIWPLRAHDTSSFAKIQFLANGFNTRLSTWHMLRGRSNLLTFLQRRWNVVLTFIVSTTPSCPADRTSIILPSLQCIMPDNPLWILSQPQRRALSLILALYHTFRLLPPLHPVGPTLQCHICLAQAASSFRTSMVSFLPASCSLLLIALPTSSLQLSSFSSVFLLLFGFIPSSFILGLNLVLYAWLNSFCSLTLSWFLLGCTDGGCWLVCDPRA